MKNSTMDTVMIQIYASQVIKVESIFG